jgi:hypothetical protein
VNSENETPAIDRQAIADQVIVSAGNILVAAGFGRAEIGLIFRQAAEHLAPLSPRSEAPRDLEPMDLSRIRAAFVRFKPVSQLQPLIARAQALFPLDREDADLKQCFDLVMQMAPLIAEAQKGLRGLAEEAGLPVFASRDASADPGMTGADDALPAVCLDDFETAYRGAFEAIGAVADELLRREDSEAFTFLLGHLAQNDVVIDRALHAVIERAMHLLHA